MIKMIFRKVFPVSIVFLLAGMNLIPMIQSTSSHNDLALYFSNEIPIQNSCRTRNGQPPSPLAGLAPHMKRSPIQTTTGKTQLTPPGFRGDFYAYNAYGMSMDQGPVTFDSDAEVHLLQGTWIDFISGSDFDYEGNWYGVNYYGGLYQIDPYTGDMNFIANTIPWLTSMVIDETTGVWYVSTVNGLLTIDIETGETTPIGLFDISTYMISIMINTDGNMYGYDVVGMGHSTLYAIDKSTGVATTIGDMGHTFCYAQEGKFDRLYGGLYLAAYEISGQSYLATCDVETAQVTIINDFSPWGVEIDGLAVLGWWLTPGIGVNEINAPVSGDAEIITPEVTVENHGWYDIDNVPVNMKITKNQCTDYFNQHFDGVFPPAGWSNLATTDFWVQSSTSYAGGTSPEAILSSYNNQGGTAGFQSAYVDTSSSTGLELSFRSYIDWGGGPCNCTVEATGDGGTTWNDVSPWTNPITVSLWPWLYTINISAYIGTQTGIRFMYSGLYTWMNVWAIDDVWLGWRNRVPEYNQTMYVDIPAWVTMDVTLPDWTPSDLGVDEDVNLSYIVRAATQFPGNYFPFDFKQETITLHFGYYINDVAVTQIVSPVDGLAETQIPEVVIENHGQNAESVNVSMTIGKALYTTLLEEDFAGGVPPAGWGTNYPDNWYSSSTNYAGGEAPEAIFNYYPSTTDEHLLYTGVIDTTGYTTLALKYKEMVNDYNSDYTLKVVTSIDGGATWQDAYMRAGGSYGPATTEITLTATNGVGSATLQIAWDMSGYSWNINYWYIDDVWLGIIDMILEYDQTVLANINPGETINVILPDWTPADVPFATTINYLINATVSMNVSDEDSADNELAKLITLFYEHDVGIVEITKPDWYHPNSVEGIIQNLGVTYSEGDIPVNAYITKDWSLIYNETVIVASPLSPGAIATVIFPDITYNMSEEGFYKLTMQTQLVGDDHPNNDKKTKTWEISYPDTTPPTTNATISGTMGQNDWYISNVQVILTAVDNKWPHGVAYTLYKIDDGEWIIYFTPIIVDSDSAEHVVSYYSVDNAGNIEATSNVTFKIDKTTPVFIDYTFIPLNFMKDKWLCNATVNDVTSGVVSVEFYVDNAFIGSVETPPYEFEFAGKPTNNSQALAYDEAGNSALSPIAQYYEMNYQTRQSHQILGEENKNEI